MNKSKSKSKKSDKESGSKDDSKTSDSKVSATIQQQTRLDKGCPPLSPTCFASEWVVAQAVIVWPS